MKILKKLPKWALIALAAVLVVFIAAFAVSHFSKQSRISGQRERIQQQQQQFFQEHGSNLPVCPDIWD